MLPIREPFGHCSGTITYLGSAAHESKSVSMEPSEPVRTHQDPPGSVEVLVGAETHSVRTSHSARKRRGPFRPDITARRELIRKPGDTRIRPAASRSSSPSAPPPSQIPPPAFRPPHPAPPPPPPSRLRPSTRLHLANAVLSSLKPCRPLALAPFRCPHPYLFLEEFAEEFTIGALWPSMRHCFCVVSLSPVPPTLKKKHKRQWIKPARSISLSPRASAARRVKASQRLQPPLPR